jgi:hypothetical protein
MRNQLAWVPEFALALFSGDIAQFNAALQPMIQVGYLETSLDDYLTPRNGYWASSDFDTFTEQFEKNRGVTITKTRPGLKAPVAVATDNTAAQAPYNNGITATDFSIEQYTFSPFELEDGIDLDLIGTNFAIVDRFEHDVEVSFQQGYQSVDLLARDTFIRDYGTGSTIATGTAAAGSNVTILVDDIRAFQNVITVGAGSTNGVLTPVSSSNKLPITVYPSGSMTGSWTANVELATPAGPNISNLVPANLSTSYGTPGAPTAARANGVSGTLTLDTIPGGKSISQNDVIVAGDAAAQVFSTGVTHFSYLPTSSSGLASTNLLDAVNILENNGVPFAQNREGDNEGTYCAHGAPNVFRSLYNDADFKQANQTLGQSEIYIGGRISKYLGITFLPNTNAPKFALAPYGGSGYAYATLVTGHGAIVDRWYAGLEDWAMSEFNPAYVILDRGIAFTFMPAYGDRQGRRMHIDWLTIRDMVCPTDVTRSSVILTGNGARRARAVIIWTWAAT